MPSNIDKSAPNSAVAQATMPTIRGKRRAQASQREQSHLSDPLASPFNFDISDPAAWPPLLRISDICRDPRRRYPGILPLTRSAFLTAVEEGYIARPVKLGAKVVAWRKQDILDIVQHGVVGRREQGRRAKARAAQRRAAAEEASLNT